MKWVLPGKIFLKKMQTRKKPKRKRKHEWNVICKFMALLKCHYLSVRNYCCEDCDSSSPGPSSSSDVFGTGTGIR
jgi:hypothetical protein